MNIVWLRILAVPATRAPRAKGLPVFASYAKAENSATPVRS